MKSNNRTSAPVPGIARQLPKNVWALGLVSMFMDISSELVHSLLPIFMTSVLPDGISLSCPSAIHSFSSKFWCFPVRFRQQPVDGLCSQILKYALTSHRIQHLA